MRFEEERKRRDGKGVRQKRGKGERRAEVGKERKENRKN